MSNTKSKYMSWKLKILNFALIPLSLLAALYIIKYVINEKYKHHFPYFSNHIEKYFNQDWNFEGRFNFALKGLVLTAIIMIINIFCVIFCRLIYYKVDPVRDSKTMVIDMFNRIIKNTIEQILIFYPLYFYLELQSESTDKKFYVLILLLFLFGRAIFLFGYIFSYFTKIIFIRNVGSFLNYELSLILLVKYLNLSIYDKQVMALLMDKV